MHMRRAAFALSVALVVTAAACSSEEGDAGGEPAEGGTLRVARTADIDKLDPQVAIAFSKFYTLGLVYDKLTDLDEPRAGS